MQLYWTAHFFTATPPSVHLGWVSTNRGAPYGPLFMDPKVDSLMDPKVDPLMNGI